MPYGSAFRQLTRIGTALGTVIVILPLVAMVLFSLSLHVEAIPSVWTTKWYTFNSSDVISSIVHSLEISVPAVAIALVITMPLSFAMARWDFAGKRLINQMILLPMLLPGTALGLALVELYNTGFLSQIPALAFLIAAHVAVVLPVIARPVIAALEEMDVELETASMSLGASPFRTILLVTVPAIFPTVLVGCIFGLARSITDFAVTLFLVPAGFLPMSIEIYNSTNYSIPQLTSANAVILLAMSLLVVGIGEAAVRRVSRG
jgi:ABC-type spermidine/putrescine transport system permease subunit II